MWTHVHPYEDPALTVRSIELHGRMALQRALNLRRLVTFVGSGASIVYGQPTWTELAAVAVDAVREQLAAGGTLQWSDEVSALATMLGAKPSQIRALDPACIAITAANEGKLTGRLTIVIEQCEMILAKSGDAASARTRIAERLLASPRKIAAIRIARALGVTPGAYPADADRDDRSLVDLADLAFSFMKTTPTDWGAIVTEVRSAKPVEIGDLGCDVLGALLDLDLQRFVTLNYDVEIERRIARDLPGETFDRLVGHPEERGAAARRATAHDPGDAPSVSVTLDDRTVTDLVNFSVHPRRARRGVMHLHGRADRPEGLILTEADYKRLYVKDDVAGHMLRDARQVLFAGNDVLFVGTGMDEADVLGVLRLYMTREQMARGEARQSFALLEATAPVAADASEAEWAAAGNSPSEEDVKRALELKLKYDIHTIFYGVHDNQYKMMRSFFNNYVRNDKNLDKIIEYTTGSHATGKKLKTTTVSGEEVETIKNSIANLTGSTAAAAEIQKKLLQLILGTINGRMQARALIHEIARIDAKRRQWWDEWRVVPRQRRPVYHQRPEDKSEDGRVEPWTHPVWVRFAPRLAPAPATGSSERSMLSKSIWDFLTWRRPLLAARRKVARHPGGQPATPRLRVMRLAMRRGSGRGTLVALLQDRSVQRELFDRRGVGYAGAFIATTAFGTQFSSVISALSSFVAGRIAWHRSRDLAVRETAIAIAIAEERPQSVLTAVDPAELGGHPHRLEILELLLREHAKGARSEDRLFVCLAGLDRLCDEHGDGYSPAHRAFFRLITGQVQGGDWPIDLVLVSGSVDPSLAYLSEPGSPGEHTVSATGKAWKPWTILPRLTFRDKIKLLVATAPITTTGDGSRIEAIGTFLQQQADRSLKDHDGPFHGRLSIQRAIEQSTALTMWCFRYYTERVQRVAPIRPSGEPLDEAVAELGRYVGDLEGAAGGDGLHGVLRYLLREWHRGDCLDGTGRDLANLRQQIMRHLVLFVTPVEILPLLRCPRIEEAIPPLEFLGPDNPARPLRRIHEAMDVLVRRGLVVAIEPAGGPERATETRLRYVLHDQIREHLAHEMKLFVPDGGERNHFQVSLHCSQPRDLPTPSPEHFDWVRDIVRNGLTQCRDTLGFFYKCKSGKAATRPAVLYELPRRIAPEIRRFAGDKARVEAVEQTVRAIYGMLRGGFSISAVARIAMPESARERRLPFDEYRDWLRSLVNVANGIDHCAREMNAFASAEIPAAPGDPPSSVAAPAIRRAFFTDEIAWLLNERGLVSYVQGRTFDAVQHFQRAFEVVRHTRGARMHDASYHAMERRIGVNWVAAQIDRGNIVKAAKLCEQILAATGYRDGTTPSLTRTYAGGYAALCNHISGSLEPAEEGYRRVVETCNRIGNMRGVAIFQRHRADLAAGRDDFDTAAELIRIAIAAAGRSEQQDVLHEALLSHASLLSRKDRTREALERIDQVENYARGAGILKTHADALRMRAEIMFRQGETDASANLVCRSIALCNRHGMRLRKLHGLMVYAEILHGAGKVEHARQILVEARGAAERHGYHTKAARAHRLLARYAHELREPSETENPLDRWR